MSTAIEFKSLTKKFGDYAAVNNLSAKVESGRITGFLGPNGAGKSTALRCLLGLAHSTSGEALVEGVLYQDLLDPIKKIGAVIDSAGFQGSLTALQNLKILTAAAGIDDKRAVEVLEMVDLAGVSKKKVKEFSLGMHQRLSLAAALLGDPDIYVLDEPANGLDPIGIAWLRSTLRALTERGKTVLVSSHLLSEMQNTVDDVIIINNGKLVAAGSVEQVRNGQTLEEAFIRLVQP